MFELSVALKYLMPRWRQLSVSIISLISILVISLVVWLIVVFFSVTNGLEKGWIQKLTALTAPVRVTPTPAYYDSYYYLVDGISSNSNYSLKNLGEKLAALESNPYDPYLDEEPPFTWLQPDTDEEGQLKDLVKITHHIISNIPNVSVKDYEVTMSNLRLRLLRPLGHQQTEAYLNQAAYVGSIEPDNSELSKTLLSLSAADINNVRSIFPNVEMLSTETKQIHLPTQGEGILVPKSFRDVGVLLGDKGHLSYYTPTASTIQEQKLPVYVAGFYDPGIIPIGGKFILASPETTNLIRSSHNQEEGVTNGFNVRFSDLNRANEIKAFIQEGLKKAGIDRYWDVQTYREYEFTKDLLQQLQSDKTLFMLISTVIIIVACSNIISMLIILVNNKKLEIGILRSMGATSRSIATIFGICGIVMGATGSIIGTFLAFLTLTNIDVLVSFLSKIQGHNAFNPMFYGETLPNEMSVEALLFVIGVTSILSLIAGIVPAVKASIMNPSSILRAE